MRKSGLFSLFLLIVFLLVSGHALAQEDKKGCKDHLLFSRMEGFYITKCEQKDFDTETFIDPETKKKISVEGRKYSIDYGLKTDYKNRYSRLQISRNYINAITKIGGMAFENDPKWPDSTYMKVVVDGKEIWAVFWQGYAGLAGRLCIVEKQAMIQEIVADAKFMAEGINTSGHVAIYGIYFDFNKANIKPESENALKEITKLLQHNPQLNIYVVGHTDNIGGLDYNMKLSQQRADVVVKELVSKYNIASDRLKSAGVGPLAPIAANETEEGKAKNRRVELVKQ
ncbi:MAG TPA: OmpA family protein [Smithellaceae bacterium]|nr:OmpA family protein [Smithellaceae bacterium]HRS89145.1 OmpA family protein [Smithellaceae bacterium]HRV25961.1 OmpA family protein [Smithellaceae bacterium]